MRRIRNIFIWVLSIVVLSGVLFLILLPEYSDKTMTKEGLINEINQAVFQKKIPGMAIVILENGKVTEKQFIGYGDVRKKNQLNNSSLFQLSSNSKSYTAAAVRILIKEGKIESQRPVTEYLPELKFSYQNEKVAPTVAELLNQTSGLSNRHFFKSQSFGKIRQFELDSLPGEKFEYTSLNYSLLGTVVEAVTNEKLDAYLEKNIFIKNEMNQTVLLNNQNQHITVSGYKMFFNSFREEKSFFYSENAPAAYVASTIDDVAKWLEKNIESGDSLLGKSQYEDGWFIENQQLLLHEGVNPNFSSFLLVNPKEKQAFAVLCNMNSPYTSYIGNKLYLILNQSSKAIGPSIFYLQDMFVLVSVFSLILMITMLCIIILKIVNILKKEKKEKESLNYKRLGVRIFFYIIQLLFIYSFVSIFLGISWNYTFYWLPANCKYIFGLNYFLLLCLFTVDGIEYYKFVEGKYKEYFYLVITLVQIITVTSKIIFI